MVPISLRKTIGRNEIRRSLGDIPPSQARRLAEAIGSRIALCFAEMMRKKNPARDAILDGVIRQDVAHIIREPDGRITLEGVKIDPTNHE